MWYYVRSNERFGPVDEDTIVSLIQNGTILRRTLVWKAGMQDWHCADDSELADKFLTVPPSVGLAVYVPSYTLYTHESLRKLWIWYTSLMCFGIAFFIIFIGIPALIAASVLYYILLYRFWTLVQDGKPRTSPGLAVGLCFIPLFNIYWVYVANVGLAKDMNLYCKERGLNCPQVSEKLAIAWYVVSLLSIIPYVGIAAIILQIILIKQFLDTSKEIIISKSK